MLSRLVNLLLLLSSGLAQQQQQLATTAVVNQLAGLPPLPKPHCASNHGITANDLLNPGRMALWAEFARIAHTLPVCLMPWGPDEVAMQTIVALARQHNASISVQYSPWYSPQIQPGCTVICTHCGPLPPGICDPRITTNDTIELEFLRGRLENLTAAGRTGTGPPVKVTAVFLDAERFAFNHSSTPDWKAALARKQDLIHDLISSLAPDATIAQYGRGGVHRIVPDSIGIPNFRPEYAITADGWSVPGDSGYYPDECKGDVYTTSMYRLDQLAESRADLNRTIQNAIAHGMSEVVPVLCLGCGDQQRFEGHKFSSDHNYSRHFSWVWGAELNNPAFAADAQRFAAYDYVRTVAIFPGPFGEQDANHPDHQGLPEHGNSTTLDHFVSYVWGAAGVERLF